VTLPGIVKNGDENGERGHLRNVVAKIKECFVHLIDRACSKAWRFEINIGARTQGMRN
jgi:hypothetical protein